ncbi:MAG: hypothetical protein HYW45_02975 [Candidatus Daviesbacteria bacterium]|nr:MAG: hypothetical protein HYW45_02975 [Candidatus Daviesbacteria bacterium]
METEIIPADRQVLAECLFDRGCIGVGDPVLLSSGLRSRVYANLRRLPSFPEDKTQVVGVLADLVAPLEFDSIADVPTGATTFVSSLCDRLRTPQITPRINRKIHGLGAVIEGYYEVGEIVLLIDDVVTTGGSILRAAEILERAGLVIRDVATIIDREQGGRETLAERGYTLHAAYTLKDLMDYYKQRCFITPEEYGIAMASLS